MNCPAEVGKEISFILHNYKSIDKMIERRREDILGTIKPQSTASVNGETGTLTL